jgi:methyl-accepting chemotaxis protein
LSDIQELAGRVRRQSLTHVLQQSAANRRGSGIGQVSTAVTQLDQVTQQNAALVEESAAAAESLKHQAGRLAEVVSVFKVQAVPV